MCLSHSVTFSFQNLPVFGFTSVATISDPVQTYFGHTWPSYIRFSVCANRQHLTLPSPSMGIENGHCHFWHPAFPWHPNANDVYLPQYADMRTMPIRSESNQIKHHKNKMI